MHSLAIGQSSRRSLFLVRRLLAACAACGVSAASAQVLTGPYPAELHYLKETSSTGGTVEEFFTSSTGNRPDLNRIVLGDSPHRSALGPTYAEVYSRFENGISTYWTFVNAYPGFFNDNGTGVAQVQWIYTVRKDRPDATFTMDITGGRLQLVEYGGVVPVYALVSLTATAYVSEGEFSRFEGSARLDGHGGAPAAATFFPDWEGFQIASANYVEQRDGDRVVGATLDIPAQPISLDLSMINEGAEFAVSVDLFVQARAVFTDGQAAMAFLRDPTQLGNSDPLAGSPAITFSGLTLLAPVPEPSSWALLAAGLIPLLLVARRRSLRVRL